ncbi:hypothetical protein H2200_009711 [Cladophialophora chaetospira]|uniref:Xylanolytic transcriptional activator regulatory domain-containing protein n=1 Tax=Cladophialophora chaetospira TaxID=386627 RepID=A0AA38X324_9EURO|nr:hypothetical protein H2200_009711 [Cladophialophora chaetospira]
MVPDLQNLTYAGGTSILSNSEGVTDRQLSTTSTFSRLYPAEIAGETNESASSSFPDAIPDFPLDLPFSDGQFSSFAPDFTDDFSTFMDRVPNLSYAFSPSFQPLPELLNTPDLPSNLGFSTKTVHDSRETDHHAAVRDASARLSPAEDTLLSRYGSRLPSLQPEDAPRAVIASRDTQTLNSRHFLVTTEYRQRLIDSVAESYGTSIDKCLTLASRHALARYVGSYFKNFHDHYPFFHVPTLRLENINEDLFLSIAALGARYTREQDAGIDIYNMARSVAFHRLSKHQKSSKTLADSNSQSFSLPQTFLLLIAVASWSKSTPAVTDALSLRSILHALTLEDGKYLERTNPQGDWNNWVRSEAHKRSQLVIFCFFNIHTILFDLPPMMLASELDLDLPCSEAEWRATSDQDWRKERSANLPRASPQRFEDALTNLFVDGDDLSRPSQSGAGSFSALAGYALIHAVIQQIWLVRNSRIHYNQQAQRSLANEDISTFERALKRWASCWERNQESSMDPVSPDGPLTFTSTALLRLAYIRLNMDLGPIRSLSSWDPHVVAGSLYRSPAARRTDKLARAALHCAHALSIPVKLGINYVAQTQLIHWSNQHALCSLECAVLLAKWLEEVTPSELSPPITEAEKRVLDFVVHLVVEAEYKITLEQISQGKERLSATTVRLWARLYQSNSVWETVNLIGQSLTIYAELLEAGNP